MGETLNLSVSTFGSGSTVDENGTLFYWFSPADVLKELTFGEGPVFEFWCQACSAQWTPQLLNENQFSIDSPPNFPCLDQSGVADNGLCYAAQQWLYSSFWRGITGGTENTCGGGA